MDVWRVTPPEHRRAAERVFQSFRTVGQMTGSYELARKDGTRCETEFRAVADILPGVHLGVMRDVTVSRRREATVRHQAQMLAQIQESIVSIDLDLRVTSWNRGAERMYGYSSAEAVGRHISFVYPPEERDILPASLLENVMKNGWHELDVRLRRKDGTDLFGHVTLSLMTDEEGQPIGVIGATLDITARTLAEQQLAKAHDQLRRVAARAQSLREEERRRLSRELHDQLGQALTGLKINLSWIANRLSEAPGISPGVQEKTDSMLRAIDHTIESVRRTATELRPSVLDKLGLVAAIEWQANEFERGSGVRCHVLTNKDHVNLDTGRATAVFRIIEQALTNVARHARASSVAVSIAEENGRLAVSVADNGCGIARRRLEASTSLGIIGMRERAALLGGTMEILSKHTAGTKVFVTIPLKDRRLLPRQGPTA
jgi:PAS domain S-box-containing protein